MAISLPPGLYNGRQAEGWRKVTDAVHAEGGHIFAQLWHVGRVSHTSVQPGGDTLVGPTTGRAASAKVYAYDDEGHPGRVPASPPRALATEEMPRITKEFVRAARLAFARVLSDLEDGLRDCLKLRRMGAYRVRGDDGRDRLYDELVNYLSFCISGDLAPIAVPPCAMYLDALIGVPELWTGDTPRLGDSFIAIAALDGFPHETFPGILSRLMRSPFPTAFPRASFRSMAMRPSPNSTPTGANGANGCGAFGPRCSGRKAAM